MHNCSPSLSPCGEAIDAFTINWAGENNYMFSIIVSDFKRAKMYTRGWNPGNAMLVICVMVATVMQERQLPNSGIDQLP